MDDFFDDFDDDFEGMNEGFDDDWNDEPDVEDDRTKSDGGIWDGPEWQDWMIIGPMSEEIAREKLEQERARKKSNRDDEDYWEWLNRKQ